MEHLPRFLTGSDEGSRSLAFPELMEKVRHSHSVPPAHAFGAGFASFGWLMVDRLIRLAIGLVVGLLVARHLGPEEYGRLSYALSVIALVGVAIPLGLDAAIKREFLTQQFGTGTVLSSVVFMRLVMMVASIVIVALVAVPSGDETRLVLVLASGTLFTPVAASFDNMFESRWLGRSVFLARAAPTLGGAAVRLLLLKLGARVEAFAAAAALESVLLFGALFLAARAQGGRVSFRLFDWAFSKAMLRECWPLLAAGIAVTIYSRIDQIMLKRYLGEAAVGMYAAAARLSELSYFVPMLLASTMYPALLNARNVGVDEYRLATQRFYDVSCIIGLATASFWWLGAPLWIRLAYGAAYVESAPVLSAHAWAAVFVYLGVARSNVLSIQKQSMIQLGSTSLGAVVNVCINSLLIPKYGMVGAAWATVIGQATAAWLSLAIFRESRTTFAQISLALSSPIVGWRRILGRDNCGASR